MKKIIFVTTNQGKVKSLQNRLPISKFTIIQKSISLPELQGDSSKEISEEKAKAAYQLLKKPLLIQDSGFHITALNGFPGIYIKYVQQTLGLKGLMKLMKNVNDRSCYFEQAVTYIDGDIIKTFVSDRKIGTLSKKIDERESARAWGIIWKVFIPHGFEKSLSAMTEDELASVDNHKTGKSEFSYFAKWLIDEYK